MKNPGKKGVFSFESYELNSETKEARFNYRLTLPGKVYVFTERLIFPKDKKWGKVPDSVLAAALQSIHLMAGVSYWKAYCPAKIEVRSSTLNKDQAKFWNKVYTSGLGEFFYRNKIDFRKLVNFPSFAKALEGKPSIPKYQVLGTKSLLLFGGGKDSYVSAELMKKGKKPFDYFCLVTGKQPESEIPKGAIIVRREIDPQLFALNRQGAFNGHVPISAIIAFVSELAALIYGYRYIIASNERSADYGNLQYRGVAINHQWSKSLEFEKLFQDYSRKYIAPGVTYFSLLRPFYEIKIIELFSRLGKKYFSRFMSCNANFKINRVDADEAWQGWCGHCPKCAFVFAMLSVFIPKKKLVSIFGPKPPGAGRAGKNLFADKSLLPIYRELLGIRKFKPFECVGTSEEVKYAFSAALAGGKYDGDATIEMFLKEAKMSEREFGQIEKELFSTGKHLIPKEFRTIIPIYK